MPRRSWLRGLLALALLAAGLHTLFATHRSLRLGREPFNTITWTDCLLAPLRRDTIGRKQARADLLQGLAAWDAGRTGEAQAKLEAGLARLPGETRARFRLAELHLARGDRARGLEILGAGLGAGYPGRDYVEDVLAVARLGEDDAFAVAFVEQAAAEPGAEGDRPWLEAARAEYLSRAGRWTEVLAVEHAPLAARVRALAALGRGAEAEELLQTGAGEVSSETVLRLRAEVARERGDVAALRAALSDLRRLDPGRADTLVVAAAEEWRAGEHAAAEERVDDYLFRFGATAARLRLLGEALAEVRARPLFQRVVAEAGAQGLTGWWLRAQEARLALLEADWPAAERALEESRSRIPDPEAAEYLVWQDGQETLLAAARGGNGGAAADLIAYVQAREATLPALSEMVEVLLAAGRTEPARELAAVARARFPGSVRLRTLAAGDNEVPTGSTRGAGARVAEPRSGALLDLATLAGDPPPEDQVWDPEALASPAAFTGEWNGLAERGEWPALREMLAALRQRQPPWLPAYESTLYDREVDLLIRLNDPAGLVQAVRRRLDGSTRRGLETVRLAEGLEEAGRRDVAELLVAEVLARDPDLPAALRRQRAWAGAERAP